MNQLTIPLIPSSDQLEAVQTHRLAVVNWKAYPYLPDVSFQIARTDGELLIRFFVIEQTVRAVNTAPNSPVYQDSCVEFFTQPVIDKPYLNFEFNAIGTCLSQKGMAREGREFLPTEDLAQIRRVSSFGTTPFQETRDRNSWNLFVAIPLKLIFGEANPDLTGKHIRGNFYKCGDKLREPHYVSWNPIPIENPGFHRPDHFGILRF